MHTTPRPLPSILPLLILVLFLTPALRAVVALPEVLGDNMVIQRDRPTTLWGWADPGEKVTVTLGSKVVAMCEGKGRDAFWKVELPPQKAGRIPDITVSGATNSITLTNLLAGEVWLCGGQSNMVMTVAKGNFPWCKYGGVKDADKEVAAGDHPDIRFFTEESKASATPSVTPVGKWLVCTPGTVGMCSGTGYFFARQLQEKLHVPVGLVISALGSTAVEPWTPLGALERDADFAAMSAAARRIKGELSAAAASDAKLRAEWTKAAQQAKAAHQPPPPAPRYELTPAQRDAMADAEGILGSATLFNGKIHPLTPLTVGGALWYQGESNGNHPVHYRYFLTRMIEGWRDAFGQRFPFLIVQLAKFRRSASWEQIRESQDRVARELPSCGIATAIDIGEPGNIHPLNKQDVGRRLALVALNKVYGLDIPSSGPRLQEVVFRDGKAIVTFARGTGNGLVLGGPGGFQIAGDDRKFVPATAVVRGETLEIASPSVAKPAAVRYAFENCPETPLSNAEGLPAFPFRTDDWQIPKPEEAPSPSPPTPSPAASAVPVPG